MSFFNDLQRVLRQNIREYGMFIALFLIMAIFTITTKGIFISSRNISNLLNQTGYIAVLAIGMTLVIVIRHKVTGSIIGALVMLSLTSGMNLMGIDISLQYIVRGTVLVQP